MFTGKLAKFRKAFRKEFKSSVHTHQAIIKDERKGYNNNAEILQREVV